ncbi:hypothetical protein [Brevibacillus massiliensis]|uniref:hypothetical protein n=1 Tax=Brevibacillus massiliensis TaxID=1118054 RepID=UPI001FE01D27|nr:hypothetical protein [Brevibacillus massiliensis]
MENHQAMGVGGTVSDNGILLGKRHFLFCREQTLYVEGWTFQAAPGFKIIAGGSANPFKTLISLYRDTDKVAQLCLTHRRAESQLSIEAVASDVSLEVSAANRAVSVADKG